MPRVSSYQKSHNRTEGSSWLEQEDLGIREQKTNESAWAAEDILKYLIGYHDGGD